MSKTMDDDPAPMKGDREWHPRPTQEEIDAGVSGTERIPPENLPPGVKPRDDPRSETVRSNAERLRARMRPGGPRPLTPEEAKAVLSEGLFDVPPKRVEASTSGPEDKGVGVLFARGDIDFPEFDGGDF